MKNRPFLRCLLLSFFGAVLTALTLIFPQIGLLEWVSVVPIFLAFFKIIAESTVKKRELYLFGFVTFLGFDLVLYHWFFVLYPLDFLGLDTGAAWTVVLAGWLGVSVLQALVGGFLFLLGGSMARFSRVRERKMLQILLLSALWTVFEWSATLFWWGLPWGRLALGQVENLAMLQSASLFGSYFVGFLILSVNGLFAAALCLPKRRLIPAELALSILLANLAFGEISLHFPQNVAESTAKIGIVQGNISSYDKWNADGFSNTVSAYAELVEQAAQDGAELILLPETVFPFNLNENQTVKNCVSDWASSNRVTLLVGALYKSEDGRLFNALYQVTPEGVVLTETYQKQHLVPFGEYVPARWLFEVLIPPLTDLSAVGEELVPGEGGEILETPVGQAGGLICFDTIYEEAARERATNGAEFLVVASNDSWFLDSAAVYQHEAQSVLRAIETGKSLVRAANTGISAMILPTGEHLARIEPMEAGYAVCEVPISEETTLYDRIGNLFVLWCGLFAIAVPVIAIWQPEKSKKSR